jgi:hypothetical protein
MIEQASKKMSHFGRWNITALEPTNNFQNHLCHTGTVQVWLISVPAMIDDSNLPRFKQRLEI